MYKILDTYQIEGYKNLLKISNLYKGAFLCDSVGLGKTFIGLMLIERLLLYEKKRVVLLVPKAARESVWEAKINKYIPGIMNGFLPFKIINHSDLLREKSDDNDWPEIMKNLQEQADVVIIDEAHNFRNRSSSRYRKLYEIISGNKQLFLLTATPINNSLLDLQHQIELFTQRNETYFKSTVLGINSVRGHFLKMEKDLLKSTDKDNDITITDEVEAEIVLAQDPLFHELVVQRSRAYAKKCAELNGSKEVLFPVRNIPRVVGYSLKKVYGKLLEDFNKAFSNQKPLLNLPIYYPYAYYIGDDAKIDPLKQGRQKQVVALIKILLLKRFESSVLAFYESCENLLLRLLVFVKKHDPKLAETWEKRQSELLERIKNDVASKMTDEDSEDYIPDEFYETVDDLNPKEFDIRQICLETLLDLDQLAVFLNDLRTYDSKDDDKLNKLLKLLKTDKDIKEKKLLIFTEFKSTAVYLTKELKRHNFKNVFEIDGDTKLRSEIIKRFAPYYNDSTPSELKENGSTEIDILISTDVLSEGLNLQDATCLINYDIHWNPVRLMQRIGRIDRRMDKATEAKIIADKPELEECRGKIFYWNFLPPNELNQILSLYSRVTNKTLKISKTFGIEGKKLLSPEDDFEALKEFNAKYDSRTSNEEEMLLEYKKLITDNTDIFDEVQKMPLRVYSGKENSQIGIFLCFKLPAYDINLKEWTEESGITKWYLYNPDTGQISDDVNGINRNIKCARDTKRKLGITKNQMQEIIQKVEKHITNTYFKQTQAPIGVKAILKCWMQLN